MTTVTVPLTTVSNSFQELRFTFATTDIYPPHVIVSSVTAPHASVSNPFQELRTTFAKTDTYYYYPQVTPVTVRSFC